MSRKKGFTLLELLAVLIILSVLATIAIQIFSNKGDTAKQLAHNENVRLLQKQAQAYLWQKEVSLPKTNMITDMASAGYIKEAPSNPYKGKTNYKNKNYIVAVNEEDRVVVKLTEGYNGVCNMPDLVEGMTPLIFDASINNFRDATKEEIDNKSWYQYNGDIGIGEGEVNVGRIANEKWANVRLKDGSMFVWIPRYAYNILKAGEDSKIWIRYSNGVTDDTSLNTANTTPDEYNGQRFKVHSAFNFGGTQLTGIWVAKFEASGTTITAGTGKNLATTYTGNIKVIPGVSSWRSISVNDIFNACRNMQLVNSRIYGISSDSNIIDTHMMKNSEWGAVAYLTEAIRDGDEVEKNTNTGCCTGGSSNIVTVYTNGTNLEMSSTGNQYGVYDLNGGASEYVASYTGLLDTSSAPGSYGKSLINADKKYKDTLETATGENLIINYNLAKGMTDGWALHEVMLSGLDMGNIFLGYNDYVNFPYYENPSFLRGGYFDSAITTEASGIFSCFHFDGRASNVDTFRPVIVGLE